MRLPCIREVLLFALVAAASHAGARAQERDNPHGAYREACSLCHGAESWTILRLDSPFDHGNGGFPLTGSHASVPCRSCHSSLDFAEAETACVSCHQDLHLGELGMDCARCHSTRNFIDPSGMIRAHRTTRFPLTGAHLSPDCESCHEPVGQGQLVFVNRPTECLGCHREDYEATTDPDHRAAGFSHDCEQCHSATAWPRVRFGSGFDHNATAFPLSGAHRGLPCQSCHQEGVFGGLRSDCVSCHQQDYDATTDPDHRASGFSTDCASCHGTSTWAGGSFEHDGAYFPINSGPHKGKWTACSDCHINPSNYSEFSCTLGCHEHGDEGRMAEKHQEVPGYSFDSRACYNCHPRGRH